MFLDLNGYCVNCSEVEEAATVLQEARSEITEVTDDRGSTVWFKYIGPDQPHL